MARQLGLLSVMLLLLWFSAASASDESARSLLARADSLLKRHSPDSTAVASTSAFCRAALEKAEIQYGEGDTLVATIISRLGDCESARGMYEEAETLYRRALNIRETALGPKHPDLIGDLRRMAACCYIQGNYPAAEPLYRRALSIGEGTADSAATAAAVLNELGILYFVQDRYREAETCFAQALDSVEDVRSLEYDYEAKIMENSGFLYWITGRFSEAETIYIRAWNRRAQAVGLSHPDVAGSLTDLGILNYSRGNYLGAEKFFDGALSIFLEQEDWYDGSDPAQTWGYKAKVCETLHSFERAETFKRIALDMEQKSVERTCLKGAEGLDYLMVAVGPSGADAEKARIQKRAAEIRARSFTSGHSSIAARLNDLAGLLSAEHRHREAATYYQSFWFELASGIAYPEAAQALESVSVLEYQRGDSLLALSLAGRAIRIKQELAAIGISALTERDALLLSKRFHDSLDWYLTCYASIEPKDSAACNDAANIVLRCKGQVSDEVFSRQRSLEQDRDSTVQNLRFGLAVTKASISQLLMSGSGEDGTYEAKANSLSSKVMALEDELCRRSLSFRERRERQDISVQTIASILPQDALLIEYVEYDRKNLKSGATVPHYLALALQRDKRPVIADLGRAADINRLVADYRDQMEEVAKREHMPVAADQERYARIARRIFDKALKPFEELLSSKNLVFVAPDGALNLVSFGGLMSERGNYLIEDYAIQYLCAGRDLIRYKYRYGTRSGLLALGAPDYNSLGTRSSLATKAQGSRWVRNVRSGCRDLSTIAVDSLVAAREEVYGAAALWEAEYRERVVIRTGSGATEDNFKALAPGKRGIHLSTHGYYLEARCGSEKAGTNSEADENAVSENPLLLSGLLLAGANQHGKLADSLGFEDGILTAYEVSAMDLTDTDLVVLSACETGLGDVKEGEGVYGLRRAFQMAGARTVVSALWSVPDEITARMMNALYTRTGKPWSDRLRDIQLERISELRKQGTNDHPYSWAGFIAVGARGNEPRPPSPPMLETRPE